MAKRESVYYALPVEEMRGKLATKQKPITYGGQTADMTPYDLTDGVHQSNNFRRYVVLTKTRGKNRFYVKSKLSVNVSRRTKFTQAVLGLGADIARHLYPVVTNGLNSNIYDALVYRRQDGQSELDVLTSVVIEGLRRKREYFEILSRPDISTGLPTILQIAGNPFCSPDVIYADSELGESYTKKPSECRNTQKFYSIFNDVLYQESLATITVETSDLRTKQIQLFVPQGGAESESVFNTIIGHAYASYQTVGAQVLFIMTIYNDKGSVWGTGELYTDSARTSKVVRNTPITDGMTLYLG